MKKATTHIFPFLLVLFEIATYLSSDMYLPALPTVMRDFAISHAQAQWTLTAWFLGAISVQLLLGPIADRFGRKKILCLGGIIFIIATLGCAIAPTIHFLIIARFIQGSGVCFVSVPGYASIHESFGQREAIKLLALMGSISVLAPAFGPLLGSVILLTLNWRWIFVFLSVWSCVAVTLLILKMPETLSVSKRQPLKLNLVMHRYRLILQNSHFLRLIIVYGAVLCGFITWIAAGPFLVIDRFQHSPMQLGFFQSVIFISYILSNYLVKKLIHRVTAKKLIQFGLTISFMTSLVALVVTFKFPNFLWGMIITYIFYAFGSGFAFAPLNRLAIESSDAPMGAIMAIFSTFMSGFATLGSSLVGFFYNGTTLSISIIIFAMISVAFLLERTIRY
jgi:DHA1 family multidrug/chloramphenicol efflux transport protein-like MFS transporter